MMMIADPRKLLRRRSSLVVADLPTFTMATPTSPKSSLVKDSNFNTMIMGGGGGGGGGGEGMKSPPPPSGPPPAVKTKNVTFEEPSAESLLDNFGY